MQHIPEIAIVEQNTLTALGLQTILEELIPVATIRTFPSFARLIDDTPDMYSHYFVSAQTYFEHTSFFLARRPKTIVLAAGEQPSLSGIPTLNVCLPQDKLVKAIMQMRKQGHEATHHPVSPQEMQQEHDLSPREIEVLILITKGLINKEIADKLNISLTTVISHRKNITEKLGIKSVSGLAIYAVMHGYVEADRICTGYVSVQSNLRQRKVHLLSVYIQAGVYDRIVCIYSVHPKIERYVPRTPCT